MTGVTPIHRLYNSRHSDRFTSRSSSSPTPLWRSIYNRLLSIRPSSTSAKNTNSPRTDDLDHKNQNRTRQIYVNLELPHDLVYPLHPHKPDQHWVYPTNQIKTTKYTILTFIPKNLSEQFRRVANVFFLVLVILQFIPKFTQVSPFLACIPLLSVLAITAIKDGYEDVKRHHDDRITNSQPVLILDRKLYSNPNLTALPSWSQTITNRVTRLLTCKPKNHQPHHPFDKLRGRRKRQQSGISHWSTTPHRQQSNGSLPVIPSSPKEQNSSTHSQPIDSSSPPAIPSPTTHSSPPLEPIVSSPISAQSSADKDHKNQSSHLDHRFSGFELATWQELRVGDFVLLRSDDSVPADLIICSTSDQEENVCFIETKNLDGETNLKSRYALPQLSHLRSAQDCARKPTKDDDQPQSSNRFIIESQLPHPDLYSYTAALIFPDVPAHRHHRPQQTADIGANGVPFEPLKVPVDLNSVLLRGTVIRNTEWVIGVVIMNGQDTKIVLNSSGTPSKRSKIERQMNPMVFINLTILAAMCVFNAIGTHFFEKYYYERNSYWSVGSDLSDDNPNINGLIGFAYAMITYQNIVPISLYISIEFVRTIQAWFIYQDPVLNSNGKKTLARSWNLSDDLGQIQYIISDKTGTLTQNLMQFRQCSIGAKVYKGTDSNTCSSDAQVVQDGDSRDPEKVQHHPISSTEPIIKVTTPPKSHNASPQIPVGAQPLEDCYEAEPLPKTPFEPFQDHQLIHDLAQSNSTQSRLIHGFFATLALCHTVLASENDKDGTIVYKSQSPDEAALVQTAADVGFVFKGREKNVIRLEVSRLGAAQDSGSRLVPGFKRQKGERKVSSPSAYGRPIEYDIEEITEEHVLDNGQLLGSTKLNESERSDSSETQREVFKEINEYELVEVNAFTSSRKRMSVILRKVVDQREKESLEQQEEEELYLLIKGADNMIFERLRDGQDHMKKTTDEHLELFAAKGYRTLCLGYKKLDRNELNEWLDSLNEVMSLVDDPEREKKIEDVQDQIERDIILLGATAIEDRLQDGVPQAIEDLKTAGIKVWVATGDKLETAVAIARTCNLISNDMNLIVVRGGEYGSHCSAYDQIRRALVEFFEEGKELVEMMKERPPGSENEEDENKTFDRQNAGRDREDFESIVGSDNGKRSGGYGLVIDGEALKRAFEEEYTREILLELSTRCESVVCCRTTPKQKSEIVTMIKEGFKGHKITLAIGDGANDVSMIQTADIGVGVRGEEGLQAINSSDYSISEFKDLNRLLFLHGQWSIDRNSKMIINFFHKEIIGISVLFLFQFWCGYSTTTFYEYTYLLFYNVFWTLLPVIGIGVFDQNVREKIATGVPKLYSVTRDSKNFSLKRFMIYMIEGTYQGMIIYGLMMRTYDVTSTRSDGFIVGIHEFSTTVIVGVVIVSNLFNGFNTVSWNWWIFAFVLVGPVLIVLYTAVYSAIKPGWIWTDVYGNNHFLWGSAYWWFGLMISVVVSMLPRLVYKYYQTNYHPTDIEIMRNVDRYQPTYDFQNKKVERVEEERKAEEEEEEKKGMTTSELVGTSVNVAMSVTAPQGIRTEFERSTTSFTHDMATGALSSPNLSSRGFNFDQADGVGEWAVGSRLRRYNTSVLSVGEVGNGGIDRLERLRRSKTTDEQIKNNNNNHHHHRTSMRIGNLDLTFGFNRHLNSNHPNHQQNNDNNKNNNNNSEVDHNNNNS